jgi:hypothetical protein
VIQEAFVTLGLHNLMLNYVKQVDTQLEEHLNVVIVWLGASPHKRAVIIVVVKVLVMLDGNAQLDQQILVQFLALLALILHQVHLLAFHVLLEVILLRMHLLVLFVVLVHIPRLILLLLVLFVILALIWINKIQLFHAFNVQREDSQDVQEQVLHHVKDQVKLDISVPAVVYRLLHILVKLDFILQLVHQLVLNAC